MRKLLVVFLCVLFALASLTAVASAKKVQKGMADYQLHSEPSAGGYELPEGVSMPKLSSAVADTFHLYWANFDGGGLCTAMGWTAADLTSQLDEFFHVATEGSELDGGSFGKLHAIEGLNSLWCGAQVSAAPPYCGYATLPGYGNGWDQIWCSDTLIADTIYIYYWICWDSEPDYDDTRLEVADLTQSPPVWTEVTDVNGGLGLYDGVGLLRDSICIPVTGNSTQIRFHFTADGAWSDEDGLWDTDGAVIIDSICVTDQNLVILNFEDFEDEVEGQKVTNDGMWYATTPAAYGDFSGLFPGVTQVQEDPCFTDFTCLWAFHNGSAFNYACGGFPAQPAVPKENADGLYIFNEVWSPTIPFVGAGADVILTFNVYRDLPLDNLVFYVWHVRSIVAGCPGNWVDYNFVYYGGQKDWIQSPSLTQRHIGGFIEAGATDVQLALGAWDMCGFWCGQFGTGACHSHTPLIDDVHLVRVNTTGPQWNVRHIDLLNDQFPDDGTTTGTGRIDMAIDLLPGTNANILPGDSAKVTCADPVSGLGEDTPGYPSVYCYVAVWPQASPNNDPAKIQAPETEAERWPGSPAGPPRFPHVGSEVDANGTTWHCYRMDQVFTANGGVVADGFCIDLNDNLFVPCDTICYFFAAKNAINEWTYRSRTFNGQGQLFTTSVKAEAQESPNEVMILPSGGWKRGGDILYVDDSDDRPGPGGVQQFFDTAFEILGILPLVDRYDVMGPSSLVSNSPGGRGPSGKGHGVVSVLDQIIPCYQKIIWCSGNLNSGLIGDGMAAAGGPGPEEL